MKKLAVAVALAASVVLLSADTADAATGTASVQIVNAIAISKTVDLNFGQIIGGAASVVTVDPAGERALVSGTATLAGGPVAAAEFAVVGGIGSIYTITLPVGPVSLTPGTMTVSDFTSSPTVAAKGELDGAGTQTLFVGGQLNVGATPALGVYTGDFEVTVAYE